MKRNCFYRHTALGIVLTVLLLVCGPSGALAEIQGIPGPDFQLSARTGVIQTSDGEAYLMWGYADGSVAGSKMQYPGPTLIVNQGDTVTVMLTNNLPAAAGNTSIVFPGQVVTTTAADPGVPGVLTNEAINGGTVTYQFTATEPGTYLYRSGSRPDLQVEMGLVGAIVVYPSVAGGFGDGKHAYNHADSRFDREFLLVLTEMDPTIHRSAEYDELDLVDTSAYMATNWFANGRNFPDNLSDDDVPWLPHQPYKFNPRLHPGENVLVRSVAVGSELHPFHYHGNDFEVIGVDGRMLSSLPGAGANLAWKATTLRTVPGQTVDLMWTWNAEKLGWDIYDHVMGTKYPYDPDNWDPDNPTTYICGEYLASPPDPLPNPGDPGYTS